MHTCHRLYGLFHFKYPHRLRRRCAAKTPKHPPRNPAGAAPQGTATVFVLLYTQERGRAAMLTPPALRNAALPGCRSAVPPACRFLTGEQAGRTAERQAGGAALLRSSFSSRIPVCQSGDAGEIPAGRTIFRTHAPRASLRSRESKSQPAPGSTEAACHFTRGLRSIGGPLPCKQQTPERNRQAPPLLYTRRPACLQQALNRACHNFTGSAPASRL